MTIQKTMPGKVISWQNLRSGVGYVWDPAPSNLTRRVTPGMLSIDQNVALNNQARRFGVSAQGVEVEDGSYRAMGAASGGGPTAKASNIKVDTTHVVSNVNFQMPQQNILRLKGEGSDEIVVAGLLPNAGKALAAKGLRPHIAVVDEIEHINEIFFPSAIGSAQEGNPVTIVVPKAEVKEAVEKYMMLAYRPFAKSADPYAQFEMNQARLMGVGIPQEHQEDLAREISYYDPICERDLGKLIEVVVVKDNVLRELKIKGTRVKVVNNGYGNYSFNGQKLNAYNFSDVKFDQDTIPNLTNWNPRYGVFMPGVNSGGYPNGFSASMLARTPKGDVVIDCGPQVPTLLEEAKINLNKVKWVITHTHPDHDSGIFDLLNNPNVSVIDVYTHAFAAESIYEKAKILGLADEAKAKISFLDGDDFDHAAFVNSEFNITPSLGQREVNGLTIDTEWTLHGIPTIMLRMTDSRGKTVVYTSDGAFSEDRLDEISTAGALSTQRRARMMKFIGSDPANTLLIEEIGRGGNHSTKPMTLAREPVKRLYIHWAKEDDLGPNDVARTYEIIEL